jgi:hypothetical protein
MYEVRDESRTLKFDGALLSFATSYRPGSDRWVEFSLYRTTGGQYVLSRVGETTVYHVPSCVIVRRNNLRGTPRAAMRPDAAPCVECHPDRYSTEEIMQEVPRHWAQVSEVAEGVVDSLYRFDESGSRYLTGVARRLLDEASEVDGGINDAYRVETIF